MRRQTELEKASAAGAEYVGMQGFGGQPAGIKADLIFGASDMKEVGTFCVGRGDASTYDIPSGLDQAHRSRRKQSTVRSTGAPTCFCSTRMSSAAHGSACHSVTRRDTERHARPQPATSRPVENSRSRLSNSSVFKIASSLSWIQVLEAHRGKALHTTCPLTKTDRSCADDY